MKLLVPWSLPLLAWTLALCTVAGAAHELHRHQNLLQARSALAALPQLQVTMQALELKDYQAIQNKTATFGAVEVTASPGALLIRAAALSDYAAWRLTLDQVLMDNPGVSWRIDALCSGPCAAGESHRAALVGRRVSVLQQAKNSTAAPTP